MKLEQLQRLNADHERVYGHAPQHFCCPILLKDEDVALCDGHVVCEKVKGASKKTVIQRADVDAFYGSTLEPDLITYLNLAVDSSTELLKRPGTGLSITMPDGTKTEAFFSGPAAREKFQQIAVTSRDDGSPIAYPFLRDARIDGPLVDMEVSWQFFLSNSAVLGSLIKSGYLALFRIFGYSWVENACLDRVRRALKAFYDAQLRGEQGKRKATEVFSEFEGCVTVLCEHSFVKDSVESNAVLMHHIESPTGLFLFAVSCFFKVNTQMLLVTLPMYSKSGYCFIASKQYFQFLRDPAMNQDVRIAQLVGDTIQISGFPVEMRYMSDGPLDNESPL